MNQKSIVAKTVVLTGEKALAAIKAYPAPNPNQPDRIEAMLDGRPVMVAKRGGNGGVDINKLTSGKVFAVAADGFSPLFEKDAQGKATKEQKVKDGLPYFLSSGFYVLSSREYPACDILQPYVTLIDEGEGVAMVTQQQLAQTQRHVLLARDHLMALHKHLLACLDDQCSLVRAHDEDFNRKRRRMIQRAGEEAEDAGETYEGVAFEPLKASTRDGAPCVLLGWRSPAGELCNHLITRHIEVPNEDDPLDPVRKVRVCEPKEVVQHFWDGRLGKALIAAVKAGRSIELCVTPGHTLRTSVSFKRKVQNLQSGEMKKGFGDAVFIEAARGGWVRGIVSVLPMFHPQFPKVDYDSLHYVAAPRQAEIELAREQEGGALKPRGIHYCMAALQHENSDVRLAA